MARPSQAQERRKEFLPIIARAFAERGYRRATTAELARRCGVRENVLFRLWDDKKAMFLAAIDYVYAVSADVWHDLLGADDAAGSSAERLLAYESAHEQRIGRRRIVFAGLNETDDPEIRDALARMYEQFHTFISAQIEEHREGAAAARARPDADLLAWAFIGLATVAYISKDLGVMGPEKRRRLVQEVGELLLAGRE